MAQIDYNFPRVDFGILGDLPATAEEGRLRAARQSLGDMQLQTPQQISAAAERAFQLGDIETGTKLAQIASQRITANAAMLGAQQRGMDLQLLLNYYGKNPNRPAVPVAGGEAPGASTTIELPPPPPRPETPAAPGPQGALTPSEEVIQRAQEAGAPQAVPPVQVAQAGPGPVPVTPQPAVPRAPAPTTTVDPQIDAAIKEATAIRNKIINAPPAYLRTPEGRADMAQLSAALARAKASPEEISYQQELVRLGQEGRPYITRSDFKNDQATVGERVKFMNDTYKTYQGKGQSAGDLEQKLIGMQEIMNNPRFSVGDPTVMEKGAKYLGEVIGSMKAYGVPLPAGSEDMVKTLTTPVALKEAFQSLSNQAVTSALGGLSKSISDADRNFLASAYPALSQSKQGMELIGQFLREAAKRHKMEAGIAARYSEEKGTRGTGAGMDLAVDEKMSKYAENNPIFRNANGNLTPFGETIGRFISGGLGGLGPAPVTSGGGPPSTGGIVGPGGKRFKTREEAWQDYYSSQGR